MKPGGALSPQSSRCCYSLPSKKLMTSHLVLADSGKGTSVTQRVLGTVPHDCGQLWEQHQALSELCNSSTPMHWMRNSGMDQLAAQHNPKALQLHQDRGARR